MVSHPKFAKIRTGMKRGARVPDAVRHLVIKKWSNSVPYKDIVEQLEHVLSLKSVQRIIAQEITYIKSGKKVGVLPSFVEEIEAKKLSRRLNRAKHSSQGVGTSRGDVAAELSIPTSEVPLDIGEPALYWKKSKEGVRLIHVMFDLMPQYLSVYGRPNNNELNEAGDMDEDEFWQQATQLFNNRDYRPVPLPMFITDPHLTGSVKKNSDGSNISPEEAMAKGFSIAEVQGLAENVLHLQSAMGPEWRLRRAGPVRLLLGEAARAQRVARRLLPAPGLRRRGIPGDLRLLRAAGAA